MKIKSIEITNIDEPSLDIEVIASLRESQTAHRPLAGLFRWVKENT